MFFVETIARNSPNIAWKVSADGERLKKDRKRMLPKDKFYDITIGKKDTFLKTCMVLTELIDAIIDENKK